MDSMKIKILFKGMTLFPYAQKVSISCLYGFTNEEMEFLVI
jgi:hypothetical protein